MESSGRGHRDGVEITSIGALYQGPLDKKYWSSSRGKEKYPYPVGYQATRWHGGHCYFMEVSEGPRGPSFVVRCEEGISCSGQTPSVAWEDILKKKHAGAKRVLIRSSCTSIDGAEMFGFTNPLVQRLCRDLVVSASGAAQNSSVQPKEEVRDCKEHAAEGSRRKAGSLPDSSVSSPAKSRKGKKSIQSSSTKIAGEGAEEREKNTKQRVVSQLMEEEQEIKETRKQKAKRPARENLETTQDVRVVERTQINTMRKNNSTAQHSHPEDAEMPSSKRSKLPKPKVGPHADEDTEHVGASQNVTSTDSKRIKSLSLGTKRIKGEDTPEGQMSKDPGHVTPPHGLSDGERQNHATIPFVRDTQESSGADYRSEVPMRHLTASGPSQVTSASDLPNVDEASQRNASRKKRMKIAKPQKILNSVKPEKYDTEVDLTQSEGFLSIDLMCPSAEDVKMQTSGVPSVQKFEDVSSKPDGYLMLLAACKVAEVEQKNGPTEKIGGADVKRKRPISEADSSNAAGPEVICFPTSSKALRLSAGHVAGVNIGCSPPKVDLSDVKVSVMPPGAELLTGPQFKEDVISHDKLENMQVCGSEGERILLMSNSEGKTERYPPKRFEREEENGSSHTCESPTGPDRVHASNFQTTGSFDSSLNSRDRSDVKLLLHEQVSKNLEGTRSGDQQDVDEAVKVSDEAEHGLEDSSRPENGEYDTKQSGNLSTALPNCSVACTVPSSDAVPMKVNIKGCASNVLDNVGPGDVDPLGAISSTHNGTSSRQTLESAVEVAKAVENINSEQPKVCAVEVNPLGTTCDFQNIYLSACAAVNDVVVRDENLPCKEFQGSRSLTTVVSEDEEASLPHNPTTTVSQSNGTNQPLLSVQAVGGSAAEIKIGCSERAADESCLPVVKVNHIELGALKGTESSVELNPGNCREICVNTVLSSDQGVDLTTSTISQKESEVPSLDGDGIEGTVDHPETQGKSSSNGNLNVEMLSPAMPIDTIKTDVQGSSARSKEDRMKELVPATLEVVKVTEISAKLEYGNSSENGFATGLTSKELVDIPIGTVPQEQVFDSKHCTEISDCVNKHVDVRKTPVSQIAEADVVSSNPSVDNTDLGLADRGARTVMEKVSSASIEVVKDTQESAEQASEPNCVTLCGENLEVSLSTDTSSQKDEGLQVCDLEGSVDNVQSPVFVSYQTGCSTSDCRGADEEEKQRAVGDGNVLMQDVVSDPALSPEQLHGGENRSGQLVDSANFQEYEQEKIEHPAFISPREESLIHTTTTITTHSLDGGVLEEKHVHSYAGTTSNRDPTMMEVVSPLPSQMQSSASPENQTQRSDSDSVRRELTTSIMTLLLPEAVPLLARSKRVEKKEVSVVGEDDPPNTGEMDAGASVSLVGSGYLPAGLPAQANVYLRTPGSDRVVSEEFLECKPSTGVGIVKQVDGMNDPVLNQNAAYSDGGSSVEASVSGGCMEVDPVEIGSDVPRNTNIQEQTVSSEVCHSQENVADGIGSNLKGGRPSELHPETSNGITSTGKGSELKHINEEFARSDTLSDSAEDGRSFSVLSPEAVSFDHCQDNKASRPEVIREVADEHLSSCVTPHLASLNQTFTQVPMEGQGLKASSDASSLEGFAQVQQEVQICKSVVELDLDGKSTLTKAEMKTESTNKQLADCTKSGTTALETLDIQECEHPGTQNLHRINRDSHDVGIGQGVHPEEIERCGDSVLVDKATSPIVSSRKLESNLLHPDASCGHLDRSEDTSPPAAASELTEKVNHADPESSLCSQPSLPSTRRDESVTTQPSYFQKLELPISIVHPTKVSTMVINVRGDEIRLCVCCGTGSERTLSVFKIQYTEGQLEHQLVTVLETSYKNHYCEDGKIKLVSEESGLSFTPDGQQLILLGSFELRDSSITDTHYGHGIKIVSLEKQCQSSTRLESDGTLLCLAVLEPQRFIAAGEGGHINFWDMDPSWRSFQEKVSLPNATLDGVPFTSITSLLVVPHLQHMVVGCNPSGFFALWDMNSGTLLYSCQMFDHLLLKASLVDTKSMSWEQPTFSEESVYKDTPQRTEHSETQESLAALPLICLLTMVTSKERCIPESGEDALGFKEQKLRASEEEGLSPPIHDRDTDAALLNSDDRSGDRNERKPQHQPIDTRSVEDLQHEVLNFRDEAQEGTTTDPLRSKRIPGPWECKTVLMRGGRIVCGHALSDRPTCIASIGYHGVMGTADGLVHLWDVENGRKLLQLDDLQGSAVVSLATCSSMGVLATAGENNRVNLYLQKDIFAEEIKNNS